jgi:GT2 family glycosyltransferase
MKVLAIVVNYRTADMTLRAVRSVLTALESLPASEVVIVDNDSRDGSADKIAAFARDFDGRPRVSFIASNRNGGFGYGVNLGVRYGLSLPEPPDYFYLVNSDAFPDPSAVRELVSFLERAPRAGIAGSYVYGLDGYPHVTAFRFPSFLGEFEKGLRLGMVSKLLSRWRVPLPLPEGDQEVDWVAGASMMLRREVFADIGLFDETFFLYFEETDFCRRARNRGWCTYYVRSSAVAHIGSASTGMKNTACRVPEYWFDSRHHYFKKNHGAAYLAIADLLFAFGFSCWRFRRKVQKKPDQDPPDLLREFVRHSLRARRQPVKPAALRPSPA